MLFDESFQTDILRCILKDPIFFKQLSHVLDQSYFDYQVCADIFTKIVGFIEDFEDSPTYGFLIQEFDKFPSYAYKQDPGLIKDVLRDIYDSDITEKQSKAIRDRICHFHKDRVFRDALTKAYQDYNSADYEAMVRRMTDAFQQTLKIEELGSFMVAELTTRLDDRENPEKAAVVVPTGFPSIDKNLKNGGLEKGDVAAVIGPVNSGKSQVLINLGSNAKKRGYLVYHYTLENSKEETAERYDACFSNFEMESLITKRDKLEALYSNENLGEVLIKQFQSKEASIATLEGHMYNIKSVHGIWPDLVIIDYFDEMALEVTKFKEIREVRKHHMTCLRSFAQRNNVALWTAVQGNTQSKNRKIVDDDDIAEGSYVIHPIDLAVSISETNDERKDYRCRLYVVKNRKGPRNFAVVCDKNSFTMRITERGIEAEIRRPGELSVIDEDFDIYTDDVEE